MPATSKAQQKAAGAALSAKRGETPKSELKGASRQMADSMSESQLEEFASTRHKGLPTRSRRSPRKAAKKAAPKKGATRKTTRRAAAKKTAKKTGRRRA
jgi:hypothetical protein